MADRGRLYVDKFGGEGRAVPGQSSSHWVGLPFAITTSIFGGPAESIALWFKSIGHEVWFSYYLSSLIAISLIVAITMRDTRRYSALGRHE